ncbi:MAG: hypothetical protein LC745_13475 [Planctomycetia bacterium]|nr:hypothetical protein [Planctomycetia bacterium]
MPLIRGVVRDLLELRRLVVQAVEITFREVDDKAFPGLVEKRSFGTRATPIAPKPILPGKASTLVLRGGPTRA